MHAEFLIWSAGICDERGGDEAGSHVGFSCEVVFLKLGL